MGASGLGFGELRGEVFAIVVEDNALTLVAAANYSAIREANVLQWAGWFENRFRSRRSMKTHTQVSLWIPVRLSALLPAASLSKPLRYLLQGTPHLFSIAFFSPLRCGGLCAAHPPPPEGMPSVPDIRYKCLT